MHECICSKIIIENLIMAVFKINLYIHLLRNQRANMFACVLVEHVSSKRSSYV